ncbi:MAG: hypothetical protein JXR52_02040 [Bacteroidales bacterium]|nr:hypothetical protein [Bacteroidales bacterium]MBN2697580.1 hypothetical protein [Bacteroidales bacterium]
MDSLLEILKYTIPALVVFLTTWFLTRTWARNEDKRRKHELNLHVKDEILPVRLQAYERIVLFLERISPESLVIRVSKPGYTSRQFQSELLNTIRSEYEHNLSQQTYISKEAWEKVKAARNQTINLINDSAADLKPDSSGSTLGKVILEQVMELKNPPSQVAIDYLKQEVNSLFL